METDFLNIDITVPAFFFFCRQNIYVLLLTAAGKVGTEPGTFKGTERITSVLLSTYSR